MKPDFIFLRVKQLVYRTKSTYDASDVPQFRSVSQLSWSEMPNVVDVHRWLPRENDEILLLKISRWTKGYQKFIFIFTFLCHPFNFQHPKLQ